MARVVVIFAILSLITGAMFWLARHPGLSTHTDASAVTTVPVAPSERPDAVVAAPTTATHTDATTSPQESVPTGGDALPPAEAGSAGIALNPTGDEAKILQQSTTTTGAQTGLVVENARAADPNAIALSGRADPGATVKVSVNGKAAGEVTVGNGGTWSLSVDRGKEGGEPKIALELIGANGKLLDKTNFVFKTVTAPPLSPQDQALVGAHIVAPKSATHKTRPVHAVHTTHATFRVRHGESLWRIARRKLGSGHKWRELYEANKDAIGGDPDYVRAGTRLVIPG
jgi:nucleoid-associated protein YgaU